jgi:uncharacterized metal-binding protein
MVLGTITGVLKLLAFILTSGIAAVVIKIFDYCIAAINIIN